MKKSILPGAVGVYLFLLFTSSGHAITVGSSVSDAQFSVDFPWAAAVFTGSSLCTGQFISNDIVLTAAHCISGVSGTTSVFAGNAELSQSTQLAVSNTLVHPDYDPISLRFDTALIFLADPFAVTPVHLATTAEANSLLANGASATIAGWGATTSNPSPSRLRQGATNLGNLSFFNGTLFNFTAQVLPCAGDSGGPLLIDDVVGIAHLVGTVTGGTSSSCGFGFSSASYTNIGAVREFIDANLAAVPVPAAIWLFGSGLLGLAGIAGRKVA